LIECAQCGGWTARGRPIPWAPLWPALEDAEVYSDRGSAHLMIDEIDRAISDFDRAIQLEPDIAFRYYNRGIAFSRKHQAHKAIDDYPRAIQLRPDLAPAYSNRAHEFELAGERDKAIADYRKALLLAPELRDVIGGILDVSALPEHEPKVAECPFLWHDSAIGVCIVDVGSVG
jgi:tetratricopeptide (TPR) repeat protein